jgi:hypothetical protein
MSLLLISASTMMRGSGCDAGDTFPALYPGGSNEVFAIHGSTTWVFLAVLSPSPLPAGLSH